MGVVCNGCKRCCWREIIDLHPEHGDRLSDYPEREMGISPLSGQQRWRLKHRPDGSCVYLGAEGCTIYDRRPAICRSYDCVEHWKSLDRSQQKWAKATGQQVLLEGRRRARRLL